MPAAAPPPIFGSGEMASLTRAFDWDSSPLGPVASWSPTLLASVNTLLASRNGLVLWWGPQLIQFYNDAYRPSLGRTKHPRALGQSARECWAEVWPTIGPEVESVLHDGESIWNVDQYLPIYRNGDKLEDAYWTYSYSPVREPDGHIAGVFVVVTETTSRMLAQRSLRTSEQNLQLALDSAELGTWVFDEATGISTGDAAMQRIFGADRAAGDYDYWIEFSYPEDRDSIGRDFRAALDSDAPYETEYRILRGTDHALRWIRSKGRILREPGRPLRMFVVVEDVTERKQMEAALRSSEERIRLALSAARQMGTFDWDIPNDCCIADACFCSIYGLDPELGRSGLPIADAIRHIHPEDVPAVEQAVANCLTSGIDLILDYRTLPTPETLRWVTVRATCTRSPQGEPIRFTGVALDITAHKLAEAALIQSEKLAAVGRLAASIAHEINNPLESVTNLIYLAKLGSESPQAVEYLTAAEAELHRASAITSLTLRFHRQSTRPTAVTCEELFASVLGIHCSRLTNSAVQVERRKRATSPIVCFDGEIRQVLGNLVSNAIDAMQPEGGRLLLRSREARDWRTGEPGTTLTIADSGPGIPATVGAHIFEPFYTTKGHAGTGLGLWICKEIVDRHQGRLLHRSSQRPGCSGTVFSLFLPRQAATR